MATKAQKQGMAWFKKQFGARVKTATKDTPFTLDLLTAIAVQESFEAWGPIYKKEEVDKVLELCVGDSIGQPRRKAFPRTKAELLNYKPPNGAELFALAREYLKAIGAFNKIYMKEYERGKFCHAFGIFQYDIQHFKEKPTYFLKKQWLDFDVCLARVIQELKTAQKGAKLGGKKTLTDLEQCFVAIVYNMGAKKFRASKGLKQGHESDGKFYGEYIADYLAAAKAIP